MIKYFEVDSYMGFQVHITDNCDQRCKHCYLWTEKLDKINEMSLSDFSLLVDNLNELRLKKRKGLFVYLTGGDPLLHNNFFDFVKLLNDNSIPWGILGNPFHLDTQMCNTLKSLGCEYYQMSLDGLKDTHDRIRKSGSFDETLEKIKLLQQVGIKVKIMATVIKSNMQEIIPLMKILKEYSPLRFAFARCVPMTPSQVTEFHITPQEYRDFLYEVKDYITEFEENGNQFMYKDHLWTVIFDELHQKPPVQRLNNGCGLGTHLTIIPTLDVLACRRLPDSTLANLKDKSLVDIYDSADIKQYVGVSQLYKCSKCELGSKCRGCPSVSYGYTKDWKSADPQCWKEVNQ